MQGLGIVPYLLPFAACVYAWRRYRNVFFLVCAGLYWVLLKVILDVDVSPF
jgi:hypothetical protein